MSKISDIKGVVTYTDNDDLGGNGITQAVPTLSSSYTITHPANQGLTNEHLENDGSGNLDWKTKVTNKELGNMFYNATEGYDTTTITGITGSYRNDFSTKRKIIFYSRYR